MNPEDALVARRLLVRGIVQGVGFRPFVFRLAEALGLAGNVSNTSDGVTIEVEGSAEALAEFAIRLRRDAPPLSRIDDVADEPLDADGRTGFRIGTSLAAGSAATSIPPDVAVCDACLAEMRDPADRRWRYPFINCTDCGPRFTIIEGVPYDRSRTTMRAFQLCDACRAEYEDPRSRRFHAEPNACPVCGPRVWLAAADGATVPADDAIAEAGRRLAAGALVAVKGLGGFHLAVDATHDDAVNRLRRLKQRDAKAFAVMARTLDDVADLVEVSCEERTLLESPARPIVLLRRWRDGGARIGRLADGVAPGNAFLGVMLPYAPLHHLLLEAGPPVLVMTSANPHDEPIVRDNDEAIARLHGIADGFLLHDRDILARTDDSVMAVVAGATRPVRRSRGYVPLSVSLPVAGPTVLAVGGDLKNAFCVTRGDEAFLGPHVGDLANAATAEYFLEAATHLCRLLDVTPSVIAHDLHPDYVSTRLAHALCAGPFPDARRVAVQHHQAHVLSCLAEGGSTGPALGLAMDGTGYGADGTSWGGEFLHVDGGCFHRLASLQTLPLPGGDLAAREPWRIAVGLLVEAGLEDRLPALARRWPNATDEAIGKVARVCRAGHVPRSSSLGRLFDAVSALAGVRDQASYEGEAAIALEAETWGQSPAGGGTVSCPLDGYPWQVDEEDGRLVVATRPMLAAVLRDALDGVPPGVIAGRFHATLLDALTAVTTTLVERTGVRTVALSGGSFQNRVLLAGLLGRLGAAGLDVRAHRAVPTNDGGVALGQALAVLAREGGPTSEVRGPRSRD